MEALVGLLCCSRSVFSHFNKKKINSMRCSFVTTGFNNTWGSFVPWVHLFKKTNKKKTNRSKGSSNLFMTYHETFPLGKLNFSIEKKIKPEYFSLKKKKRSLGNITESCPFVGLLHHWTVWAHGSSHPIPGSPLRVHNEFLWPGYIRESFV